MQIIAHRINTIEKLKTINPRYGVEIDIRGYGDRLLLNHDSIQDPSLHDDLESYLKVFSERSMAFVIFNTKEAGYEKKIIELAEKYGIQKNQYFLLDVEYPYMYRATRKEEKINTSSLMLNIPICTERQEKRGCEKLLLDTRKVNQ